jgi:hypothetical protein
MAQGEREQRDAARRALQALSTSDSERGPVVLASMAVGVVQEVLAGRLGDAVLQAQALRSRARELGSGLMGEYLAALLMTRPMLDTGRYEELSALLQDPGTTSWGIPHDAIVALALAQAGEKKFARVGQLFEIVGVKEAPCRAIVNVLQALVLQSEPSATPEPLDNSNGSLRALDGLTAVADARVNASVAVTLKRLSDAVDLYDRALKVSEGCRPEQALVHLETAELLLDAFPERRDEAIAHLDAAIPELRDMRMRPALERALGRRELLKA